MGSLKRSALAPKTFPKVSAIAGCCPEDRSSRDQVPRAGRSVAGDPGSRNHGGRRIHTFGNGFRAGTVEPKGGSVGQGASHSHQQWKCEYLYGAQGVSDVGSTAGMASRTAGCRPGDVLIASTGVIGEPLPVNRMQNALLRMRSVVAPPPGLTLQEQLVQPIPIPKARDSADLYR